MTRLIIFSTFLILSCTVKGQNWQIRGIQHINLYSEGADNRLEGLELSGFYNYHLNKSTSIHGGLTLNLNSWANHILFKLGVEFKIKKYNTWSFSTQLEVGNGIALFTPSPLYTFDMQGILFANYHTDKDNIWSIGVGMQNIVTPAYEKFGIYSTVNLPISIRYRF